MYERWYPVLQQFFDLIVYAIRRSGEVVLLTIGIIVTVRSQLKKMRSRPRNPQSRSQSRKGAPRLE